MTADGPAQGVLAGPGTLTAISGLTFVVSDERGDIGPGAFGLIVDDTRHLARLQVSVGSEPLRHLGSGLTSPGVARFRSYVTLPDPTPDAPVGCERLRTVESGRMVETLVVRCWTSAPVHLRIAVAMGADFADIFAVRRLAGDAAAPVPSVAVPLSDGHVSLEAPWTTRTTSVALDPAPDLLSGGDAEWDVVVHRGRSWTLRIEVQAHRGSGLDDRAALPRRADAVPHPDPVVHSVPEHLARGCRRSLVDLDALSIPDDRAAGRRLLAAGIPWFVALFGRDVLISSHQARAFRPELLLDAVNALAARQGRVDDPGNEEQPGKILHEVRFTDRPWLGEGTVGGAKPYFGSVDATPLFLIMIGEAMRWGAPREALERLLPAALAALEWLRGPGDPDGDGLVEYGAAGPRSLANQGWKDSVNGVQFADGSLARSPIAIVEVQGYAYRARCELAAVLARLGHGSAAADLLVEAAELRTLIRDRFWRPGRAGAPGTFAMALDRDKRQVDAVSSNMAHLLWCGVPSQEEAEQVAAHLVSPAMSSGWGLRTLSGEMAGFNPISYHVGSVWPHDTTIACEGLRRYGFDELAMGLAGDLLDALAVFDDRLPELFGGHRREPGDFPVPYPTACRPQAWAAGVPLALVALCLGLEPDLPAGTVTLNPVLPRGVARLDVRGVPLAGGFLSVVHDGEGTRLISTPPGLRIAVTTR